MATGNVSSSQAEIEQKYRGIRRELTLAVTGLGVVVFVGTLWYRFIEGWSWVDAAYMTIITLATVGYSETRPLGDRGRLFTVSLIIMGVVSIGYIVNRLTDALVQGYFQIGLQLRQQRQLIDSLSDHYIICGFGRTGRQIALEFATETIPFITIDSDPDSVHAAQQLGYTVVEGDATLDDVLLKVGIERATCLVAALPSDAENLYTVLSAKTLNPNIRAIARASTQEALQKLQRAGADAVVSPYITGGKRMAAAALRPQVLDFVDGILTGAGREFYMEEVLLDPDTCPCIGQNLGAAKLRSQSGALVLAIRRDDGTLIGGPTADTQLLPGDLLICMGTAEQLRQLNQILGPISAKMPRPPKHI